jgi:L-rhamnose isomerase/sugar isomerase
MSRPSSDRAVEAALAGLEIETPSWGYGDSGTRFAVFQQAGRPRDVFERSTTPPRCTGSPAAPPRSLCTSRGTSVDDLSALRAHAESVGLRIGAVNPNLFQDSDYMLGSITHPTRPSAARRSRTCSSASRSRASSARRRSRCGWPTARTTPGQDDLRARRRRMLDSLQEVYAALPAEQELLVEYKFFEPASTRPTSPTGASRC